MYSERATSQYGDLSWGRSLATSIIFSLGCPPPKKNTFWACKLASTYKVICHARNTLTKKAGSTLTFGTPGPQKVSDSPSLDLKLQSRRAGLIAWSFESPWREKQTLNKPKCSIYITICNILGKGTTITTILFFVCIFQNIANRVLRMARVVTSFRMSKRWSLYDNFAFLSLLFGSLTIWGPGDQSSKESRQLLPTCFWHERSPYICLSACTVKKCILDTLMFMSLAPLCWTHSPPRYSYSTSRCKSCSFLPTSYATNCLVNPDLGSSDASVDWLVQIH